MTYSYEFPRPNLTVDIVVIGYHEAEGQGELSLLLIQRGVEPFKDRWALPGGFVRLDETLEQAARRELQEEAGIGNLYLEQLYTFGRIDRDPRERVVSVAYFALVEPTRFKLKASTDAAAARWFPWAKIPRLAFDHAEIVKTALSRLRGKVRYEPIGFELLPRAFTLTQMQNLYEVILDTKLDKRNFRKKVLGFGVLKALDKKLKNVPYRSPSLYSFEEAAYRKLTKSGSKYEI